MTCNTSAVAVCRSFASFSSWVRLPTCFFRSAMDGAAVNTLRALGLFARRPLTGCSLPPRRRIFVPLGGLRQGSILCKSRLSRHGRKSVPGHSRHFEGLPTTSGLPLEADSTHTSRHVSRVQRDISHRGKNRREANMTVPNRKRLPVGEVGSSMWARLPRRPKNHVDWNGRRSSSGRVSGSGLIICRRQVDRNNTYPRYREHDAWPAVIPLKGSSNGCTGKSGAIVLLKPLTRIFCPPAN